jgi:SHS2 domain-containing protein
LVETGDLFRFTARVWGEKFQSEKHLQKVAVKAVTYHRMAVMREKEENVVLEFILDI